MAIVVIIDQVGSSRSPDLVATTASQLNSMFGESLLRAFQRTAGDEMQALLDGPDGLAPILNVALDQGSWWIGIGLGRTTRVARSARSSAGPAFNYAREAVEAAKHDRSVPGPVAVRGEAPVYERHLQAAVSALAFILQRRTQRQREIVAATNAAPSRQVVIERFGVSHQAISRVLAAAGFEQVRQLNDLIRDLASSAF